MRTKQVKAEDDSKQSLQVIAKLSEYVLTHKYMFEGSKLTYVITTPNVAY